MFAIGYRYVIFVNSDISKSAINDPAGYFPPHQQESNLNDGAVTV